MKKVLFSLILAILGVLGGLAMPVGAKSVSELINTDISPVCGGDTFLFMRPWYYGLECDGSGNVTDTNFKNTCKDGSGSDCETHLAFSVKQIVLVVIYDISVLIGVAAAGFLIYGGFQYAMSGGDVARATKGKKTITSAIVGLIIAVVATVTVNTFARVFIGNTANAGAQVTVNGQNRTFQLFDIDANDMIGAAVNFALSLTTVAAVGFAIYSGIIFATSYGDPGKIERAKKGLLYSVIGVVVAMLGFAIVNFVLGSLKTGISGNEDDLLGVANQIFMVMIGVAGFISVVGIVVGGIYYMTSSGDAAKVTKAKNAVIYSVVGLVVTVIAGAIISFVLSKLVGS